MSGDQKDGERIASLEAHLLTLTEQVKLLSGKIDGITTELAVARGASKTVLWFLGLFGGIIALISSFLTKKFS